VIGAERRPESPVNHREIAGNEGVVDGDTVGKPDRPTRLAAEPEPAVAQARQLEEVGEPRGPLRAVHVADDDLRTSLIPDDPSQSGKLGKPSALEGGARMNQPEMPQETTELERRVEKGPTARKRFLHGAERAGRLAKPECNPSRPPRRIEMIRIQTANVL